MILPPDSRSANLLIWALLFGTIALWQIVCLLHSRLPPLKTLFDLLCRWWVTRWALLLGWFWWGWHVWVRGGW
ncbi:MAG: hypothetical protein WD602_03840 [Actinomycetota bacterium]